MEEKNDLPGIVKEVKEDSTGEWGDENTAEIGQTVEFQTTISAKPGAESYVLHDVMSAGLTLDPESIEAASLTEGQNAQSGDYHVIAPALQMAAPLRSSSTSPTSTPSLLIPTSSVTYDAVGERETRSSLVTATPNKDPA